MQRTRWIKFATAAVALYGIIGAATAAGAGEPAAKPQAGWTGSVSEAQFKALHELKTDAAPALHGQMVDLAGGNAYLSLPANAKAPLPAVIVIHEWWGLNDHIKHWADRLAADGFATLAVDVYDGKIATTSEQALEYMKGVDQKRATEIMLAADQFLAKDPRVQAKKRGSIGWCFGGGQSLRLALAAPGLSACVMYYGSPVTDVVALKSLKAPLLGVFGNQDQAFPPALIDEFDRALTAAGVKHEILRYDAVHAFANPSNPKYDQKSASDAWAHVQAFFAENLKK